MNSFVFEAGAKTRDEVMEVWDRGWAALNASLAELSEADLLKTVTIRNHPHTVIDALSRNALHTASHVGQIVYLAKHLAGPEWRTLSMPKRK